MSVFARLGAIIMVVLALVLTTAPTVSAHWADGGGVCNGTVKIIVFDGHGQTGADDDFCYYPYTNLAEDPNFSSNNNSTSSIPDDDIGNRYLMAGYVSSVSIQNDSNRYLCVIFFDSIQYGGWSEYREVPPGGHMHTDFWLADNWYESMQVWMNTTHFVGPGCV